MYIDNRYVVRSSGKTWMVGLSFFYAYFLEIVGKEWGKNMYMEDVIISLMFLVVLIILIIIGELENRVKMKEGYDLSLVLIPLFIGLISIVRSTDLLTVIIAIEVQSVIFYTLIAYRNKSISGKEGALKYFVIGSIASTLMILGVSFLYKESGYLDINSITETQLMSYSVGGILILISLLIKIGAAPFHFWLIDAYEGAQLHILLMLVILPKIFLFYLMFIFNKMFTQNYIIGFAVIVSAIMGAVGAMKQTKIQRFLAYTVVFNNAFFLGALLVNQFFALYSLILSLIIYLVITLLNILPLIVLRARDAKLIFASLRDLLILKKSNFFIALLISCAFLSAGGLPPLIGFFGKWYSLVPLMYLKYKFLAYFLIIISIIAAYYYLRITTLLFFFKESPIVLLESTSSSTSSLLSLLFFVSCFFIVNSNSITLLII